MYLLSSILSPGNSGTDTQYAALARIHGEVRPGLGNRLETHEFQAQYTHCLGVATGGGGDDGHTAYAAPSQHNHIQYPGADGDQTVQVPILAQHCGVSTGQILVLQP